MIIIGGGVAGLSAAVYAARAGLKPLVIGGSPAGGQLSLTSEVENFPGQEAIMGADLVMKIRKQAEKFGARIIDENVMRVDFSKKQFEIYLADSTRFFSSASPKGAQAIDSKNVSSSVIAKSIIIATGAKAMWLGLESEKRLRGKGVSACATCDGFFFRGKDVAVIGGGDKALEEALTLTKFANKVYLIHRRDCFRASKVMQQRVFENKKIEVIWNANVKEILGKEKVEGIKIELSKFNSLSLRALAKQSQNNKIATSRISGTRDDRLLVKDLKINGVFVAIGHRPDTDLFTGQLKFDKNGYLLKNFNDHFPAMTSTAGIFAAGDCADPYYRQAATAAGTGVAAALDAERWLNNKS